MDNLLWVENSKFNLYLIDIKLDISAAWNIEFRMDISDSVEAAYTQYIWLYAAMGNSNHVWSYSDNVEIASGWFEISSMDNQK